MESGKNMLWMRKVLIDAHMKNTLNRLNKNYFHQGAMKKTDGIIHYWHDLSKEGTSFSQHLIVGFLF